MAEHLNLKQMKALSRDPEKLAERIAFVKEENKGLKPYTYYQSLYCHTCKSRSRLCHPVSSYCFICDTDNF